MGQFPVPWGGTCPNPRKYCVNPYRSSTLQVGEGLIVQSLEPDMLDGDEGFVAGRFFATSAGTTHINPVGRLVASTPVAFKLHKGFQQHRAITIAAEPIVWQLACHTRENFRGKPLGLYPRQNKEECVVDHQLQVTSARAALHGLSNLLEHLPKPRVLCGAEVDAHQSTRCAGGLKQ